MEIDILRSSNSRPSDHPEFLGNVKAWTEHFKTQEEFIVWLYKEGFTLIEQGDLVQIRREL